jgi:hypothetical protein
MAYLATRAYIEAFISALSKRTDIEFVEGRQFGVNLKDKVFMYDPIILQKATINEVKGVLLHEVGHLNYTTITPDKEMSKEYKKYPCLGELYNACEDIRIEHLMMKEFKSFADEAIAESRFYGIYENYLSIQSNKHRGMTGYKAFVGILLTEMIYNDQHPLINLTSSNKELPFYETIADYAYASVGRMSGYKTPEMKREDLGSYLNKMSPIDELIKKIDKCKNTKEVMALVDKNIVPHIIDLLKNQDKKDKAEGALAKAIHGALEGIKEKMEEAEKSFAEQGFKDGRSLLNDLITGSKEGTKIRRSDIPSDTDLEQLYRMPIYFLTRHFTAILEERTTVKYSGAYKRGKLLPRNVYKARTNEGRMYSKRKHFDSPFYEVSFLIDESGSMGEGSRYEDAYIAGFIINKAVQRLKFKTNYISWDDKIRPHKEYEEMREYYGGGNNEDKVLKYIAKKIDYNNEQLIFLITDGGVDDENSPRPMLEKFKKMGVNVIPIGVNISEYQAAEFKKWYPESVLVKSLDELVRAMADFMKKIIHR